jgi:hypothetical protein
VFWRRDDGESGTAVISTPPRVVAAAPKPPEPKSLEPKNSEAKSLEPKSAEPSTLEPSSREPREPTVAYSASMTGLTIFPPRAQAFPATGSIDRDPEPKSEPVLAPVIPEAVTTEPLVAKPAEAKPVELPANKTIGLAAPKQAAGTAQLSPTKPDRAAQTFRVAGVASDDVLNVRDGPSADYRATGAILPDAVGVRIVGQCRAEWCPIDHSGVTGWVNSFYLVEDTPVRRSDRQRRPVTEYRR